MRAEAPPNTRMGARRRNRSTTRIRERWKSKLTGARLRPLGPATRSASGFWNPRLSTSRERFEAFNRPEASALWMMTKCTSKQPLDHGSPRQGDLPLADHARATPVLAPTHTPQHSRSHKIPPNPQAHYGDLGGGASGRACGGAAGVQVYHGNVPLANEAGLDFDFAPTECQTH
ncbi:uncharacterized protein LOC144158247 [Haemaphysalis longicornis]